MIICLLILAACQGPLAVPTPAGAGQPLEVPSPTFTPSAVPTLTFTAPPPTATPLPMLESPLVWYAQGSAPENAAALTRDLNRLLLERGLNAQVEVRFIENGLFEQRMAEMRAAGEDWDLVSLTGAQYDLWRDQGALLPLGPSTLSGHAPETLTPHPSVLQALYRSGAVYAVPAPVPWAKSRGISIRADVAKALELEDDLYALESFQGLTPLLETIREAVESGQLQSAGVENADALRGAAGNAAILFPEAGGYSSLWEPLVVRADAAAGKSMGAGAVVNWYASEAFRQLATLRLEWQQAGFLPGEPLTPDQLTEAYREGRYVMEIGQEVFPGSAGQQAERYGYEWLDISLTPAWITTDSLLSSVTGLNARLAEDPERTWRAALLLKTAHTDAEVRRLLVGLLGWEGGPSLNDIRNWNAAAQYAPGMGFVFDPRTAGAEAAALTGSAPEWLEPLQNGQRADIERALKSFHQFLETAGMERIQAELEAQYAAWLSAQQ